MLTLADIARGQAVTITEITGEDSISIRLMEMGLTEGETVRLIGAAPLGDPLEVRVRGYKLSLRKSEASRIRVQPLSPPPPTV